ncbi:uncharacterized protein B0H18DRAFT_956353 [Fomitopsis serialis]|uniref:uncharacterized protein n=1 Tax=Fomitopsis serialis TaxID=139415 RepID=UPI00200737A3|nr:uncharacterized protein B0H18DRAFT_962178 [Neoantrodia serialis]XP_047891248.1 uncharacterized protein B0H18DRAFT_956353 [Neoantrodia serialis]KAH9911488.1 hypothetical protein B0H18DRAFT_962178 [Neoantrodia serialis]KAH9922230.1 hypothetical protein B0H18DRAFT_956353 [Neoantrodia serialis]
MNVEFKGAPEAARGEKDRVVTGIVDAMHIPATSTTTTPAGSVPSGASSESPASRIPVPKRRLAALTQGKTVRPRPLSAPTPLNNLDELRAALPLVSSAQVGHTLQRTPRRRPLPTPPPPVPSEGTGHSSPVATRPRFIPPLPPMYPLPYGTPFLSAAPSRRRPKEQTRVIEDYSPRKGKWEQASGYVNGVSEACHKGYRSYDEAVAAFKRAEDRGDVKVQPGPITSTSSDAMGRRAKYYTDAERKAAKNMARKRYDGTVAKKEFFPSPFLGWDPSTLPPQVLVLAREPFKSLGPVEGLDTSDLGLHERPFKWLAPEHDVLQESGEGGSVLAAERALRELNGRQLGFMVETGFQRMKERKAVGRAGMADLVSALESEVKERLRAWEFTAQANVVVDRTVYANIARDVYLHWGAKHICCLAKEVETIRAGVVRLEELEVEGGLAWQCMNIVTD